MIGADYDAAYAAMERERSAAKAVYVQPPPRSRAPIAIAPLPVARVVLPWRQRIELRLVPVLACATWLIAVAISGFVGCLAVELLFRLALMVWP